MSEIKALTESEPKITFEAGNSQGNHRLPEKEQDFFLS
jgi:hypothetical protein